MTSGLNPPGNLRIVTYRPGNVRSEQLIVTLPPCGTGNALEYVLQTLLEAL